MFYKLFGQLNLTQTMKSIKLVFNLFFCVFIFTSLISCAGSKNTSSKKPKKMPASIERNFLTANTLELKEISEDETYGYTEKNPICVGGGMMQGAANQRFYLNGLLSSDGDDVAYVRTGSCCAFSTKNAMLNNIGLLDTYEVTWKGQEEPIILYINLYDAAGVKAPKGFTFKK